MHLDVFRQFTYLHSLTHMYTKLHHLLSKISFKIAYFEYLDPPNFPILVYFSALRIPKTYLYLKNRTHYDVSAVYPPCQRKCWAKGNSASATNRVVVDTFFGWIGVLR